MNLKDLNIEISFSDSTISFNNVDIIIHNKISLNNKMSFISDVINFSIDANRFSNDVTVRAYFTLCILKYYTNLELTEEEFLNPADTYDLIVESGLYDIITSKIDKNELSIVTEMLYKTLDNIYKYNDSILGLIDALNEKYESLNLDLEKISETLGDPKQIGLLKDIVTKLG